MFAKLKHKIWGMEYLRGCKTSCTVKEKKQLWIWDEMHNF